MHVVSKVTIMLESVNAVHVKIVSIPFSYMFSLPFNIIAITYALTLLAGLLLCLHRQW